MKQEQEISSGWIGMDKKEERRETNMKIYKELCEKYKISNDIEYQNPCDFDVIISLKRKNVTTYVYEIIKNEPKLSKKKLALICDKGNLCFGYEVRKEMIYIRKIY